jgi:hypothetical protein
MCRSKMQRRRSLIVPLVASYRIGCWTSLVATLFGRPRLKLRVNRGVVCAEPWASRHVCLHPEAPDTFNTPVSESGRPSAKCDVCGITKRSNHRCKGVATEPKPCRYCERAGEPCVRHGGESSGIRTARRHEERQAEAVGRVAKELPKLIEIVQQVSTADIDPELSAIRVILPALDGLTSSQVRRTLAYVADRTGAEET